MLAKCDPIAHVAPNDPHTCAPFSVIATVFLPTSSRLVPLVLYGGCVAYGVPLFGFVIFVRERSAPFDVCFAISALLNVTTSNQHLTPSSVCLDVFLRDPCPFFPKSFVFSTETTFQQILFNLAQHGTQV